MAKNKDIDIRNLPSWKYFSWGILNGIFLGIFIREGVDVSEEGILTMILDSIKPLMGDAGLSTMWVSTTIFFLGLIGLISLTAEGIVVYHKGWPARIIAGSGFISFLLLILGVDTLGIIFLMLGIGALLIFPNE